MEHGIVLSPADGRVSRCGKTVRLTPRELAIFKEIADVYPETVSAKSVYEHNYHAKFGPDPNIIRVYVAKLRGKLDPLGVAIVNEWAFGYRMEVEAR